MVILEPLAASVALFLLCLSFYFFSHCNLVVLTPTDYLSFEWEVEYNLLEVENGLLGRGARGTVMRAKYKGQDVAVKSCTLSCCSCTERSY